MSIEQFPILPKKSESLDDRWYERFEKIGSFADYSYLSGNKKLREEQENKFISGENENPSLDYPDLDTFNFSEKENLLVELKEDALKNEPNEVVRQLYRWRINEKLAELRMLRAAHEGNDKKFLRYSEFIYGAPEKDLYDYTISQLKELVDSGLFHSDPNISAAAQRINTELFETLMDNETLFDVSAFEFPKNKSTSGEESFSSADIKKAFESALLDYNVVGWNVIIDTSSNTAINVNQEKKEVFIPQDRVLKEAALKALIEHEIGTHVLRREKGEKSKLRLLGLGLDRYLRGEEGLATYKQQSVAGTSDFAGLEGHLAISLALGLDGKKRNFRQVFEILKDFFVLTSTKSGAELIKTAQNNAWNRCIRTFRGTTCKTPGACFTKDIVYREGNIGIWTLSKEDSPELGRISVGKYDPLNPRHIWILNQLGITDSGLEALDK